MSYKSPELEIQPSAKKGTYDLIKGGEKFGEAVFWPGYDKPSINFNTPPGLTPREEQQVHALDNPWFAK
jgi:hypothetical protein